MKSKNDVRSPKLLDDSKMDLVITQMVQERLYHRPIANAKQAEFARAMLAKSAGLGRLRSNAVPPFEQYLKTNLQCHIENEMSRVSKMAVLVLDIGSWKRITRYKGHVVAKFLFHTRRMMWEIFENDVKNKIEILWDDIVNMKVDMGTCGVGMLQLELSSSRTPMFYQEINPQPRKHIVNNITSDFTGGEAMRSRVHTLWFCKGELDKHYERLLHYEPRFAKLNENALLNLRRPCFHPCPSDTGLNVSFGCNQNMSQLVSQQSNFQDRFVPVGVEQGKAGKRSLASSGGLMDIMQESAAFAASKDMFPRKIQRIEPPIFQETPPKLEKHGQALTQSAISETFEPMILCPFPRSEESSVFANLDNFGTDIILYCNGSEPQNSPSYYQNYQAEAKQNHENQTTVESATPLSVHSAPTDNNGPGEASSAALSAHQQTCNFADAPMQSETIQGQSTALSTIQEDRNMNHEKPSSQPSIYDAERFERSTNWDEDLIDVPSSFTTGYGSEILITNWKNSNLQPIR